MKQIKKILFPIDFAANFETLVPWVSTFADKFDATVYVLFVAQDLSHFATFYVPHGNIERFPATGDRLGQEKNGGRGGGIFQTIPQDGNPRRIRVSG